MKSNYILLSRKSGCFACINSGKGFLTYFDRFLEEIRYLYIIKGGPGTGKSGLMAHIADTAEEKGESVQRIYCSSDPDSLDGVILKDRKIALVDGTAPHTEEPKIPGVDSEIIDPGLFWDGFYLQQQRKEIEALTAKKSSAYKRAFSLLAAAKAVRDSLESHITPYVRQDLLAKYIKKYLPSDAADGDKGIGGVIFPLSSVGMKGAVQLDTHIKTARKILTLEPFYGVEYLFLEGLQKRALRTNISLYISPDPISLHPDGLFFPKSGMLIRCGAALGLPNEKTLCLRRLLPLPQGGERALIKAEQKEGEALFALAQAELQSLSSYHFSLEKIYGNAMDFSGVDRLIKETKEKIFGN